MHDGSAHPSSSTSLKKMSQLGEFFKHSLDEWTKAITRKGFISLQVCLQQLPGHCISQTAIPKHQNHQNPMSFCGRTTKSTPGLRLKSFLLCKIIAGSRLLHVSEHQQHPSHCCEEMVALQENAAFGVSGRKAASSASPIIILLLLVVLVVLGARYCCLPLLRGGSQRNGRRA